MYRLITEFLFNINVMGVFFTLLRMVLMGLARFFSIIMLKRLWKWAWRRFNPPSQILIPGEQEIIALGIPEPTPEGKENAIFQVDSEDLLKTMGNGDVADALDLFVDPSQREQQLEAISELCHKVFHSSKITVLDEQSAITHAYDRCVASMDQYGPDKGCPSMYFTPIALQALKEWETKCIVVPVVEPVKKKKFCLE